MPKKDFKITCENTFRENGDVEVKCSCGVDMYQKDVDINGATIYRCDGCGITLNLLVEIKKDRKYIKTQLEELLWNKVIYLEKKVRDLEKVEII